MSNGDSSAVEAAGPGSEAVIPRATYRLQFGVGFSFRDAANLAPYLARLGVSHVYASPYLKARSGSSHGYDIVDHNALNADLGSVEDFDAMVSAFQANGLGQILDFVPNHMGVGGADNAWWLDTLEWGPDSPYAGYFDIDWDPDRPYLRGKLLVPFLGDQYGAVLENGDLALRFDAESGSFAVWAYETHKLPVCPLHYQRILGTQTPSLERLGAAFAGLSNERHDVRQRAADLKAELARLVAAQPDIRTAVAESVAACNGTAGEPDTFGRIHKLIQEQHWRAAFFRVAADDINYRRFFNINELAGLRMDQPELFDLTHRFVLARIADGTLDGLRIDHVDGLLDPGEYCVRLREAAARRFYLVVEKILAHHEHLREDWPIEGTTGYEFANLVGGLFVDPAGEKAIDRLYGDFVGQVTPFDQIVRDCKMRIISSEMASELNALARDAGRIARSNRRSCDFTNNILHSGLKEIIARFPVYRTYIDGSEPDSADRRDIDWAVTQARRIEGAPDASVFDFLHGLLTTDLVRRPRSGYDRDAVIRFAMKVQQYCGPVMAKGLEDTAFYRYNRLVSLNEVGGHPQFFGTAVPAFHRANMERAERWPHAMLSTSTHDTKRGEDTRARLHVLSEIPEEWERHIQGWSRVVRARRGDVEGTAPPDRNDEYLLYQLLLGAWPVELTDVEALDDDAVARFATRIEAAMIKSVREAKVHSSWNAPNEAYEKSVVSFIRDCLDTSRSNAFLDAFGPFQARIARLGVINSVSQTLAKLTAPGVPDLYQGSEFWDLSLVDPDNRRPVDYAERQLVCDRLDAARPTMGSLLDDWKDGAIKLGVTRRILALRGEKPGLFRTGDYRPLDVVGERESNLCAFARHHRGDHVVTIFPRLVASLGEPMEWGNTAIALPETAPGKHWRDVFSGETLGAVTRRGVATVRASTCLAPFPFSVLVLDDG